MQEKYISFRSEPDIQEILDDVPFRQKSKFIKEAIREYAGVLPDSQSTRGQPGEQVLKKEGLESREPGATSKVPLPLDQGRHENAVQQGATPPDAPQGGGPGLEGPDGADEAAGIEGSAERVADGDGVYGDERDGADKQAAELREHGQYSNIELAARLRAEKEARKIDRELFGGVDV